MTPAELVEGINDLVSLPDICVRVNNKVQDPYCSAADLAGLISQDPALTARVLRIANSAFYGFPSKIDSIARAVTIIGTQGLAEIVTASSVIHLFETRMDDVIDMDRFWRHSLMVGLLARGLGPRLKTPVLHGERLFIGGLLHDIGRLAMAMKIPELVRVMMSRASGKLESLWEIERLVFDLDHAEVGGELLRQWKLPESIQDAVGFHHEPELAVKHMLDAAIVHIADVMVSRESFAYLQHQAVEPQFHPQTLAITGLDEAKIHQAMDQATEEFGELATVFLQPGRLSA